MNSHISIDLERKIYVPYHMTIRVGSRNGLVHCLLGDSVVEFTTTAANKAGFDLVKKSSLAQPGELVVMKINNRTIDLLPAHAKKIGGMMLRKADDADDFQLRVKK